MIHRDRDNRYSSSIRGHIEPSPAAAGIHTGTAHAFPEHLHSRFYVFAHISEGNCVCFGKKSSSPLPSHIARTDDLVIIPPGIPHSGYPWEGERYSYTAMYINGSFVNRLISGEAESEVPVFSPAILRRTDLIPGFYGCVSRIIPEDEHGSAGDIFHQQDHLLPEFEERLIGFIADLADSGAAEIPAWQKRLPNEEEERVISGIKEYIRDHLTQKISLDTLAAECGRSKFHMVRTFRTSAGIPPVQYQQLERINRGKAMLKKGTSIADTALELGFYDQSHFQNKFKAFTGITPSQYIDGQRG